MARFERELRAALNAEATSLRDTTRADESKARLKELSNEIVRLVDAIAKIGVSDAVASRLKQLEEEKLKLEALTKAQAATSIDVERLIKDTMRSYGEVVATIEAALESDIEGSRDALSKLLGRITLTVEADGAVWAEFENKTAQLPSGAGLPVSLTVVAGAGFEPTTFGL